MNMINTRINTLIDDLNKSPRLDIQSHKEPLAIRTPLGVLSDKDMLNFSDGVLWYLADEAFHKHTQMWRIEQRIKFEWRH